MPQVLTKWVPLETIGGPSGMGGIAMMFVVSGGGMKGRLARSLPGLQVAATCTNTLDGLHFAVSISSPVMMDSQ